MPKEAARPQEAEKKNTKITDKKKLSPSVEFMRSEAVLGLSVFGSNFCKYPTKRTVNGVIYLLNFSSNVVLPKFKLKNVV